MYLFLVALEAPNPAVWAALENHWPNRHRIVNDRMAFVAPEGIAIASDIANVLGMNPQHEVHGVVVQLEKYSGRSSTDVVQWVDNAL